MKTLLIIAIAFVLVYYAKQRKNYTSPVGQTWDLFTDMLSRPHLLVAGTTGSGKSVAINGLISTILYRLPFDRQGNAQMILIDPKLVEFSAYAKMPHTIAYAAGYNPDAWMTALNKALKIMDSRKTYMKSKKLKLYDKADLYIIIDEWASIYKNKQCGRAAYEAVLRLTSEGRAERVHVIMATQIPKANIIPTEIRENFDARLCLRTANAIQSRVIMDENGCENLPFPADAGYANGYYLKGGKSELYTIPFVQQTKLDELVSYWERQY